MKGLTKGRIVHYVEHSEDGGHHRAAVVTHVWGDNHGTINLFVFPDGSHPLENNIPTSVIYDENHANNTWHWIEKA